jgi:hypothetical protein
MSSLLNEAIVDAKALREAALKNAETAVIEKYSQEVKETLNNLLEQEEAPLFDLEGALDAEVTTEADDIDEDSEIPLASTDNFSDLEGQNLNNFPESGEAVEINIDLGALQEAIAELGQDLNEETEIDITAEDLSRILSEEEKGKHDDGDNKDEKCDYVDCEDDGDTADENLSEAGDAPVAPIDPGSFAGEEAEEGDEDDDSIGASSAAALAGSAAAVTATNAAGKGRGAFEEGLDTDALVDAVMERLTVDMGATLSGWAGRSSESVKYEIEKELAHRRSSDVQQDLETLKKAQEELVFENKQLGERNEKYKHAVEELKESLQDINLSNARLLYTNRILRNTSLNERQKDKIVEAISNASSVPEARTIFETLQSTVVAKPKQRPQSLSEAIGRRSSTIRASRKETPSSDPIQERMKRLAGIK